MTEEQLNELKAKLLTKGKGAAPKEVNLGQIKEVPLVVRMSEEERAERAEQLSSSTLLVDELLEDFGGAGFVGIVQAGRF